MKIKIVALGFILALLPFFVSGCTGYEILDIAFEIADDMFHLSGDDDDDGLTNHQEENLGTSSNSSDTDRDWLYDGEEVEKYKTDPLNPDTDGDGMNDGEEVRVGRNPLVPDSPESGAGTRGGREEEGVAPTEEQPSAPSAETPPAPPESSEEPETAPPSGNTYLNEACGFSFHYPDGWQIQSDEYYTMLDGTKADFPTVVLVRSGSTDEIRLNMRQSFCMAVEPYEKKTEKAGARDVQIYTYYDAARTLETGGCLEAEVEALNINGKMGPYTFVSQSNDPVVSTAFREVVETFKVTK